MTIADRPSSRTAPGEQAQVDDGEIKAWIADARHVLSTRWEQLRSSEHRTHPGYAITPLQIHCARSVFTTKLGVVPTGNSVWRNFEDDPFWSARDGTRRDCCGRRLTGQTHRFLNSLGVLDYFAKPTNHDPAEVGERSPTSTITPTF